MNKEDNIYDRLKNALDNLSDEERNAPLYLNPNIKNYDKVREMLENMMRGKFSVDNFINENVNRE